MMMTSVPTKTDVQIRDEIFSTDIAPLVSSLES